MILDLLTKLVDRCVELVKRREELHRALFEDFVDPIQKDFEAVHNNYLETFRNYRELVKTTNHAFDDTHPVFDSIKADSLFSAGMRAQVQQLHSLKSHGLLEKFLGAISNYLGGTLMPIITCPPNAVRSRLATDLYFIFVKSGTIEERRKSAIKMLDAHVAKIQRDYAEEITEFNTLKSLLLKPK
jgi:hypothetical protein